MKSGEEMRVFLQRLMGWGLERPHMYGGSLQGADVVFHYWRYIWAELTDRQTDFFHATDAMKLYGDAVRDASFSPEYWHQSCDPNEYRIVVEFWCNVDKQLGIEYPKEVDSNDKFPKE